MANVHMHCAALFRMYYYDAKSGKCKKFVYGGCGGNQNKFGTMEKCVATCKPELKDLRPLDLDIPADQLIKYWEENGMENGGCPPVCNKSPGHLEFPDHEQLPDRNIQEIEDSILQELYEENEDMKKASGLF